MRRPLLVLALLVGCTRNPEVGAESEPFEAPTPSPSTPAPAPAQAERPTPPATAAQAEPFDPARPEAAGVKFVVPPPFSFRAPTAGSMRLAEYVVPEREGERPASMTIFHFAGMGGAVRDNVNRWVAQFTTPEGAPITSPAITTRTVAGMEVTLVDVTGTYRGMNFGGAPTAPEPSHRMLGAIVAAPRGPVFFKLVGPASVVERASAAFTLLVDSLEPAR